VNNAFFKFFQDIVLSATWKKLTPSARTLYPVLAIHTNKDFKPVYPSLKRMKELSGLGNSGLASALRSLEENGLIRKWSGLSKTGNRSNVYELIFEYEGSQVSLPPRQGEATPLMGVGLVPHGAKAIPNTGQTLDPRKVQLPPQQVGNKRKRTRRKTTTQVVPTTSTTIQGDVHIKIDHGTSPVVVDSLKQFFSEQIAHQIAKQHPPEYIQEKIEITRYNQQRGKVQDPAAYLRRAISQDYSRPIGFTTTTERATHLADQKRVEEIKQRIRDGQLSVARHRESGRTSLMDVPTDLSYIILTTKHGSRCISTWDEVSQYDFET
jgi:hypothetical protein